MGSGKTVNPFSDSMQNINKKTLLIMAGGLGTRYQGLKQVDSVFKNGETLLEFSIFDAVQNNFLKIILIINEFMPKSYIERLKIIALKHNFEISFVMQKLHLNVPELYANLLDKREKPWGTGHAILCAKEHINNPFVVINADDYYGIETWKSISNYMDTNQISEKKIAMIAFSVASTLSKNGAVSRGICTKNEQNNLEHIVEITNIYESNNNILYKENENEKVISKDTLVSMNFWCFHPSVFSYLSKFFEEFLMQNPLPKQEFFIPSVIEDLIQTKQIDVTVIETLEKWKGLTYPEDKISVITYLSNLKKQNKYPNSLWNIN